MILTVTPPLEAALTAEAQRQGTTPELLALDCLRDRFVKSQFASDIPNETMSMAEYLKDFVGVVASGDKIPGGAQMSDSSGPQFTEGLAQKRRQGRL